MLSAQSLLGFLLCAGKMMGISQRVFNFFPGIVVNKSEKTDTDVSVSPTRNIGHDDAVSLLPLITARVYWVFAHQTLFSTLILP